MNQRVIAGRYELRDMIGRGGSARVYRAYDRVLGREVAIKIVDARGAFDSSYLERFKREARAAARLNHPNVITIYDWGETEAADDGEPAHFMVMEYIDGTDLAALIARRGPLPISDALAHADSIAAALGAAHAVRIVHRDIKPQNVMLQTDGRVKVTDFGIALHPELTPLTETNMVSGTAQYVSPEQARGEAADARSDIYSLGVVLYEMLTGRPPFAGGTPVEVALKHLSETPVPPSHLRPDVPPAVDALVMRALAKKREDRFANIAAFRSALAAANQPEPVARTARPQAPRERRLQTATAVVPAARGPRWEKWPWIAPLLVVLLAGGVAYSLATNAFNGHRRHAAAGHSGRVAANITATSTHPSPTRTATPKPTVRPTATPRPKATSRPAPTPVQHHASAARPTATQPPPTAVPPTPTSQPAVADGPSPKSTASPPTHHAPPSHAPAPPTPSGNNPSQTLASAPGPNGPDPASAVLEFYRLVATHQFAQATQLWSAAMQQEYPPAIDIDSRFAQTSSISAHASDESINWQTGTATVAVNVVELKSSGAETDWVGTWNLVRTSQGWLLNYPNLRQS